MGFFFYFILIIIIFMAIAGLSFAPWVPARQKDLTRIFKLADLQSGQIFYDLGSGDGRTVFYAADKFGVQAVGLEISLPMYLICLIKKIWCKNKLAKFKFKNLFKENLSGADVIYFFGVPDSIKNKLQEKLKKEVRPDAKIISYAFPLPDWTPVEINKPNPNDITIYLYQN